MLVPVIGLVQVGNQATADRYTYLPLIGLFIAIAWTGAEIASGSRALRMVALAAALLALAGCAVLTRRQVLVWTDSVALFEKAVRTTTGNAPARYNLGLALASEGRIDDAIAQYVEALRIAPHNADAHNNLGVAFDRRAETGEAISHF